MPAGINTAIGVHYGAFAVIKFAGYKSFAKRLNKKYSKEENTWKVGAFRTFLGILLGAPFGFIAKGTALWIPSLILLRIFEWFITIWLFYDRKLVLENKNNLIFCTLEGIVVSFLLDIPAIFGFVITGGLWIC